MPFYLRQPLLLTHWPQALPRVQEVAYQPAFPLVLPVAALAQL
jgi:hypothetical protein